MRSRWPRFPGPRSAAALAILTIPVTHASVALAQATVSTGTPTQPAPGSAAGGAGDTSQQQPGPGGQPGGGSQQPTNLNPYQAPNPPPGYSGPIGGGNATESSAKPRTGDESDSFDLGKKNAGATGARGSGSGPIFETPDHFNADIPGFHLVRKGDTLWGVCDYYFRNPYQWPRVWSYNPQIQNPHWIYPGDQVRLRQGAVAGQGGPIGTNGPGNLIDRRRQVPPETVFLRDQGFVEDSADEDWGELTGSPTDKMFLTALDQVYLHIADKHDVKLGQELTIYRPVRSVPGGRMVQIQGTVRVDQWNAKERVARGILVESLDVIERGARVGPLGRRFEVVPPFRNERDVQAKVITSVHPHNFFGQNQIVFIDKGEKDGLKVGNRLFIVRQGDAWRRSLATPGAANRISPESEGLPDMERTPGTRDDKKFPDEVVGELRVLAMKGHTATCMVTQSTREIERDDLAVARKGY